MLDVMEQLEPDEAVLYLGGIFNDPALETEVRRAAGRRASPTASSCSAASRRRELPRYLAAADVVWVPSQPDRQYATPTVPTKLLEGMAVGLAALVSNLPGRGELVRLEECGLAVRAGRRRPPARAPAPAGQPRRARRRWALAAAAPSSAATPGRPSRAIW